MNIKPSCLTVCSPTPQVGRKQHLTVTLLHINREQQREGHSQGGREAQAQAQARVSMWGAVGSGTEERGCVLVEDSRGGGRGCSQFCQLLVREPGWSLLSCQSPSLQFNLGDSSQDALEWSLSWVEGHSTIAPLSWSPQLFP